MRYLTKFSLALFTLVSISAFGQQLPQFSQYVQNPYLINPAASSLKKDVDLNLGVRQQWANFDGAPLTYYAGGTVRVGPVSRVRKMNYATRISRYDYRNKRKTLLVDKPKHIVGGLVGVDKYGFFQRNSFMGSYAYHQPIARKYYLAGAVSMGWYGFNFNSDDVVVVDAVDNTFSQFLGNGTQSNLFDVNAGVLLYSENLMVGYSVYQLAQNDLYLDKQGETPNFSNAKLAMHHFMTGAYKFKVSRDYNFTPSFLLKLQGDSPLSFDINLRADYRDCFWWGVSYRNEGSFAFMAGTVYQEWLKFGYSYDINSSKFGNIGSGSHELVIGFQFNR